MSSAASEPEEDEGREEGGKGQRDVDLSKDDFFMAIAKLASIRSTSDPKVRSLH